ncbi:glycoside hydrolase family 16 protein [Auriscalpium vulgare]|uniref:Glycoside hydrolase family 16 protein n=1 Tax=Auriscalpium vulgare TaxID=40419 RepID=A0ACB8S980_9AGAM|nr:glycoside hydrolase family 16 protein [Auriscalpium vulgare]
MSYMQRPEIAGSSASLLPRTPQPKPPVRGSQISLASSLSDKFSLTPNPAEWGAALTMSTPEPDDFLHNPDPKRDLRHDGGGHIFTSRGVTNLGCLFILAAGILMLLYAAPSSPQLTLSHPRPSAGYPIYSHFTRHEQSRLGGFNLGGMNATGQVAAFPNWPGLIDIATPQSAYTKPSYNDPTQQWELVFSDEFAVDGRTFNPGDDPYWEAVDLYYWQTGDLEWYDPKQATTKDGYLRLTLETAVPENNHNLSYVSGMIQSWNKFCFTGGLIEVSVQLPGSSTKGGLWPAVWTMGNLGRAGYGASLDGMWPYSYDTCDIGTLANQTMPGATVPEAAFTNGDPENNDQLSLLPGQRLSACTCPGESHPGPVHHDGSFVGRSAPEIDLFEALVGTTAAVSQSAQWAPFNAQYAWDNTTQNLKIVNPDVTVLNTYTGGAFQQTTSMMSNTNTDCYELEAGCFSIYGYEYQPSTSSDPGYITWVTNGTSVATIEGAGMGPDKAANISTRPITLEPMYIIMNLGLSNSFAHGVDLSTLNYPTTMLIDYVRVYQPSGSKNIGCDTPERPTAEYINAYPDAYANANFTLFGTPQYNQSIPRNKLIDAC